MSAAATEPTAGPTWVATTEDNPWFTPDEPVSIGEMTAFPGAFLRLDQPAQEVEGFGALSLIHI